MSIVKRLTKRLSQGAGVLVVGTGVAQAITLLATPLIARLYSAADFGYLALVTSSAALIIPAASLRFESALLLARKTNDATALLTTGAISALAVSGCATATLEVIFAVGGLSNMATLPFFSLWVGVLILLTTLFTLFSQFALRHHLYSSVAARTVMQATATTSAQIVGGLVLASSGTLLAGHMFGRVVGIIPMLTALRGRVARFELRRASQLAREYWRFPVIFAPSAILNAGGLVLPVLFVGAWFSIAEAGQWAMADRLIATPVVLIASSAAQAAEAQMSQLVRDGKIGFVRYYLRTSSKLLATSILIVIGVVALGPTVVPWLLGPGWGEAVSLLIAFSPLVIARLVATPLSKTLVVLQRAVSNFTLDILRCALVLGVIVIAGSTGISLVGTAWLVSAAMSLVYVFTWLLGYLAARTYDRSLGVDARTQTES